MVKTKYYQMRDFQRSLLNVAESKRKPLEGCLEFRTNSQSAKYSGKEFNGDTWCRDSCYRDNGCRITMMNRMK
jgi:hypothetical protein